MADQPAGVDVERYARAAAAALEIDIHDDDWPSVIANMHAIFGVARVLLGEPIADDVTAAPVFTA